MSTSPRARTRLTTLGAIALLSALTLAGCGDSDTDAASPSATPTGTATAAAPSSPSAETATDVPSRIDPSELATQPTEPKGVIPGTTPKESVTATLTIRVLDTPQAAPRQLTLQCSPNGGSHPNADAACDALAQAGGAGAFPTFENQACTAQYGGPATATITGTLDGRAVNAKLSQADGCRINQWNALAPLVGSYAGN